MRFRILWSLFCVFAIILPALAQSGAHQTTLDGKWEARVMIQGVEEVIHFEFKGGDGVIGGTVTEGSALPLEINNGRLVGVKLNFDTRLPPRDGNTMVMAWAGTLSSSGDSILFVRAVEDISSRGAGQQFEAKRMPPVQQLSNGMHKSS